jgi:hypothetical protein
LTAADKAKKTAVARQLNALLTAIESADRPPTAQIIVAYQQLAAK